MRTTLTGLATLGEAKRPTHAEQSTQSNVGRFGVAVVTSSVKVETQAALSDLFIQRVITQHAYFFCLGLLLQIQLLLSPIQEVINAIVDIA